jgi:hypothetical protein
MITMEMNLTQQVVDDSKVFKNTEEKRAYLREHTRKCRNKCEECKAPAIVKFLENKKKLCIKCLIQYIKQKEKKPT